MWLRTLMISVGVITIFGLQPTWGLPQIAFPFPCGLCCNGSDADHISLPDRDTALEAAQETAHVHSIEEAARSGDATAQFELAEMPRHADRIAK